MPCPPQARTQGIAGGRRFAFQLLQEYEGHVQVVTQQEVVLGLQSG